MHFGPHPETEHLGDTGEEFILHETCYWTKEYYASLEQSAQCDSGTGCSVYLYTDMRSSKRERNNQKKKPK